VEMNINRVIVVFASDYGNNRMLGWIGIPFASNQ